MLNGTKESLLREGNEWDGFLNYYFAICFIICFAIGIMLNPFIIAYHAEQKKSFAKFMFLLISLIDQFKLIYFPLILVPKLLSPLEDKDYYIIYNPTSVPWTAYTNFYLMFLVWIEMDALAILSVSRYISIAHPMFSSLIRNVICSTAIIFSFLKWGLGALSIRLSQETSFFSRIFDSFGYTIYEGAFGIFMGFSTSFLIIIGAIFVALTIYHLNNSDTASSEISSQNVRRGIIYLVATNLVNVFVLFFTCSYPIAVHLKMFTDYNAKNTYSTGLDLYQFGVLFVIPMAQSFFNCLSFLLISRQFRDFLKDRFM